MLGFTPFKKHANKFNYIPRYYDPEKEAREQRRAELHGERAEDAGREYKPGQYIRTQREARAARRARRGQDGAGPDFEDGGGGRAGAAVHLSSVPEAGPTCSCVRGPRPHRVRTEQAAEEFNPYAPITVVPNDYQEE